MVLADQEHRTVVHISPDGASDVSSCGKWHFLMRCTRDNDFHHSHPLAQFRKGSPSSLYFLSANVFFLCVWIGWFRLICLCPTHTISAQSYQWSIKEMYSHLPPTIHPPGIPQKYRDIHLCLGIPHTNPPSSIWFLVCFRTSPASLPGVPLSSKDKQTDETAQHNRKIDTHHLSLLSSQNPNI